MKTLVIHPLDPSTDFLSVIYDNKTDWVVVRNNISNSKLKKLIKEHERVIMLGHGCDKGLFTPTSKTEQYGRLIINSSHVYLLRHKLCIGVWCNANIFFEKYNLIGFYTGMIISELSEAFDWSILTTNEQLLLQNILFGESLKACINLQPKEMYNYMLKYYIIQNCQVTLFNRKNLFYNFK